MKEKLKNFVTSAQILQQLPAGEVKTAAVKALFEKSLPEIGLIPGDYIYRNNNDHGIQSYQFVCSGSGYDIAMIVKLGSESETFTIAASFPQTTT